ncbi:dienelactone hydrolase family protein [Phenylobacterium aquaticum]|uniref:dienelactone hydrolase family protein n=1 Tax=Phenylobacterium aquaticum TaxID=1763816 RepID=UPI0026EE9A9D|nr:dienelactone hydrolase family protein [Phenylobacterium aquaticum]
MGYEAALSDYEKIEFTDGPWTRPYYRRGSGPAVIIIHEIPGLHPLVVAFADRVAAQGMTVYLPSLFGEPGRPVSTGYALGAMFNAICIRREFNVWQSGKSSPVVEWLRALARKAHAECGGKGVGAVGMCFTGGFALAMMTEPSVVAPVLSQPSMPMAAGSKTRAAGIDASPREIACAKQRFQDEGLSMIGLRFKSDALVPDARFDTYRREFGDKFEAIELEDEDARPSERPPHSVLTVHLKEDGPSKAAEQRVIAFFKERTGA